MLSASRSNLLNFHLQACQRRRKNYMFAIVHEGNTFTEEQAKAGIVFNYYNDIIGKPFRRLHRIDLGRLDLPTLDLDHLAAPFTAAEVARIVHETPSDRAPGSDGFSGAFYKKAWEVVGPDVVRMFGALWDMDFRSFHHVNEAVMVLLHKNQQPEGLKDYRPISLIHSIGKLFAKGLAMRLAPHMPQIVKANQSAFIRGRFKLQVGPACLPLAACQEVPHGADQDRSRQSVRYGGLAFPTRGPGARGIPMALERLDIDNASLDEHESVGERQNWTAHLPRPWSQTGRPPIPVSVRHCHGSIELPDHRGGQVGSANAAAWKRHRAQGIYLCR